MRVLRSTRYSLQIIQNINTKKTELTKLIIDTSGICLQTLLFESLPPVLLIALKRNRIHCNDLGAIVNERNPLELTYSENISIQSEWRTAGIKILSFKYFTQKIHNSIYTF